MLDGTPTYPENTLPAFENAAREGFVIELDVKLTADRVPVVIHDHTLERTTTCTGPVHSFTAAAIADCRADVLGSPGNNLPTAPVDPTTPVPTLAEALRLAVERDATVNLEIKNLPTDNDFDTGSGFAERVMDDVIASGIARDRLIVQSFYPPNLDVAKRKLPGVVTSLLTLAQMNEGSPAYAAANGYDWVSPAWPVSGAYVQEAHALGRKVVPYTLNRAAEVTAAAAAGVDALITDDPMMARKALGGSEATGGTGPPAAAGPTSGDSGRDCLPRSLRVGSRGIGRIRLGHSPARVIGRAGAAPRRGRRALRYCVRGGGRLVVAFARRGGARLIVTTAPRHRARGIGRGRRSDAVRRAYPGASARRGVVTTGRSTRIVVGLRRGRVRFVAVADRRLVLNRRLLAHYLRLAGLRTG